VHQDAARFAAANRRPSGKTVVSGPNQDALEKRNRMDAITKYAKPFDVDQHILAYWLMFCRAPSRKTGPGEQVDLGEIGSIQEKNWERLTPYSPSEPSK